MDIVEIPAQPPQMPSLTGLADYGLTLAIAVWVGRKLWAALTQSQNQDQVILSTLLANQQEFFKQQTELNAQLVQLLIELKVKGVV